MKNALFIAVSLFLGTQTQLYGMLIENKTNTSYYVEVNQSGEKTLVPAKSSACLFSRPTFIEIYIKKDTHKESIGTVNHTQIGRANNLLQFYISRKGHLVFALDSLGTPAH